MNLTHWLSTGLSICVLAAIWLIVSAPPARPNWRRDWPRRVPFPPQDIARKFDEAERLEIAELVSSQHWSDWTPPKPLPPSPRPADAPLVLIGDEFGPAAPLTDAEAARIGKAIAERIATAGGGFHAFHEDDRRT